MSAPEQIPYVGYVANGIATEFPITFDLHDVGYLVVTLNKEIPESSTYTVDLNGLKVVFAQAPKNGDQVELYRDTVIDRDTDYKTYDNSFRPEAVNYDFDKIIHILQEQHMIDAELASRLKQEIEWRRTHDANFDELAKMRDAQVFAGLKGYVDTLYSASNPNIFDGVTAGIVFALDKKSVQTHLEIIYEQLAQSSNSVLAEKERAEGVEQALGIQILQTNDVLSAAIANETARAIAAENAIGVGNKAYLTYAAMDADKANIPVNSKVTITKDPDPSKNHDWQWDGVNFTASDYDPITQSKSYTNEEIKKLPVSNENGIGGAALTLKDLNNWVFGSIGEDGSVDTPLFSLTSDNPNEGFIVTDEFGWVLLEQGAADIPVDIPSWAEKKYMLFGDSITQTGDPDNGDFGIGFRANWWVTSNSELRAKSFMNFARSGASYREYPTQLTWQKISHQISYSLTTGYVPDVIIMSCATNDALTKLGTYEDAIAKNFADLDMSYTADAMRWAYHTISQNYPKAKLFTCLPIQLAAVEPHTRQPLNDLLIKMANRYGFQVINVGGECGIVRDFETAGSAGRDLYDGVHPNASGILKIASVITPVVRTRLTNV